MNYDLKTDIAIRILNKAYSTQVSPADLNNFSPSLDLVKLYSELQTTDMTEKQFLVELEKEYVSYIITKYNGKQLLDYLLELERKETLTEIKNKINDDYLEAWVGVGEIGI
jgi:hypothetical protein